ncbi:MAG: glycosyltransferase [Motilibacteraceae bacterium]
MTAARPEVAFDVSVVTSGHDVADARLHREVAALAAAGLRVQVLGLGDPAAGPPGAAVRTRARRGPAGRALLAATAPWRADGAVLVTLDPDVALSARAVAALRRRRLVVDVHEDYEQLLADRAWARGAAGRLARTLARAATRVAAGADLTVVADEHVPPHRARHRLVLRNLPSPSLLPQAGEVTRAEVPTAVYVGDVRASRGALAMAEAVARAPGWRLEVVGPVAPGEAERLERRISQPDLTGRVVLHGRRPPREAWLLAARGWVGLSLLEPTPAFLQAVPSKLHEYLAVGLPVVATDLPPARALLAEGGVLVPPATAGEATAALLRGWADDPAGLEPLRAAAARAGAAYRAQDPYAGFARAVRALLPRQPGEDPL